MSGKVKAGQAGEQRRNPGISDQRFAAIQTDPRFHRFPRKDKHVELDERFAGDLASPNLTESALDLQSA